MISDGRKPVESVVQLVSLVAQGDGLTEEILVSIKAYAQAPGSLLKNRPGGYFDIFDPGGRN